MIILIFPAAIIILLIIALTRKSEYELYGSYHSSHIKQVLKYEPDSCKGTFEIFKREFSQIEWTWEETFENSLFSKDRKSKIHASLYVFNGKGMYFDKKDWVKVVKFMKLEIIKYKHSPKLKDCKWI